MDNKEQNRMSGVKITSENMTELPREMQAYMAAADKVNKPKHYSTLHATGLMALQAGLKAAVGVVVGVIAFGIASWAGWLPDALTLDLFGKSMLLASVATVTTAATLIAGVSFYANNIRKKPINFSHSKDRETLPNHKDIKHELEIIDKSQPLPKQFSVEEAVYLDKVVASQPNIIR